MRTPADLLAASHTAPVRTLARSTDSVTRLQGLIGNRATARLMRQATATRPGSLRVRIVAHASPRWTDAQTPEQADRRNQELSERRMQTIRGIIDARLRALLGPDAQIGYDFDIVDSSADGASIDSEAHGSRDSLRDAHGNRKSNDQWFRRVDVTIDDGATVQETAGQTAARSVTTIQSKHWRIQTGLTVTGSVEGGGAGALTFTIQNADTGRTGEYYLGGPALGTPGFEVSVDPSRSWSDFETKTEVGFSNFNGKTAAYTSAVVGAWFVGYEYEHLDIPSLVDGSIDISGFGVGAGLGPQVTYLPGVLLSKGTAESDDYVSDVHDEEVPYERRDTRSDLYYAFFETASAALGAQGQNDLVEFVDQASRRYTGGG